MTTTTTLLTTPRLRLRPIEMGDVEVLHAFWTDPGVRKYLWDDEVITRDLTEEIVAGSQHDFATHGFGHWLATGTDDAILLGWCGLRYFGEPPAVEVLYGIAPQSWGQGLAVEATRAVLAYGFDVVGLAEIYAGTDPPNVASVRVMEKAGMRFAKRTESNGLETIYYVLSREEF